MGKIPSSRFGLAALAATLVCGYGRLGAIGGDDLTEASVRRTPARAAPPPEAIQHVSRAVRDVVCKDRRDADWNNLCAGQFVEAAVGRLLRGEDVHVVQIGAHVGFEQNDPIARGLSSLIDRVVGVAADEGLRRKFHWTFVEPSPPNYQRLEENLQQHAHVCDMKGIRAAVVSDRDDHPGAVSFYSISSSIDPSTGIDSLSGKKFPYFITQVSSLSKISIQREGRAFTQRGLNVDDYIVRTNVTAYSFSELMKHALTNSQTGLGASPLLVLVDTEGYDCHIVRGISPNSMYLPQYLVFEHKFCLRHDPELIGHLADVMGYDAKSSAENTVAVRRALANETTYIQ
ncbi:hypothetical protein ACHAXT_001449 [Thalassiosira profunda]